MSGNRKPQTFRNCEFCGTRFGPISSLKRRFCSRACHYSASRGVSRPRLSAAKIGRPHLARRHRVPVTCAACGVGFEKRPCEIRPGARHFCSKECFGQKCPMVHCLSCGAPFKGSQSVIRKFCSRACSFAFRRGPNHSMWKGGSSVLQAERNTPEIREWRKVVFDRDGHRCRECGSTDDLHAHHLKGWTDFPALRLDPANGLTLCCACHGRIHGRDFSQWKKDAGRKATLILE
jgi:5-methylcytosine-specific restriction endonuclease McrA